MKDALARFIAGDIPYVQMGCDLLPENAILLPGSFNPLHQGHEGLLAAAEKISGREGILELSIINVDKPTLDIVEVERRLLQLQGRYPVILTRAPTFAEKAELFPGAWFAMGYDTVIRLLLPKYSADMPAMLSRFAELGTRFVVAGRLYKGEFQSVEQLNITAGFEALFIPIPRDCFREDISSTQLRNGSPD